MSYTPVIPFSGYAGWKLLNRTMETQKAAFTASADIQRNEDYFREKIGSITTAKELVSDRRLLSVALGAFGLDDDINNKYFIQKVLEEGTLDTESLANKLSDKTYLKLSQAFGFGDYSVPRTALSDFADEILEQYETREFEVAVGDSDNDLRLALAAQRDLSELASKSNSENTKWYSIIGSESLATVVRTALGLPDSTSSLDVDQQVTVYKNKAESVLGSSDPAEFSDADKVEKVIKLFLLRSQLENGTSTGSGSAALQILQSASSNPSANILSLLL
ncbi:MAG: DUF1217 domain-containing protein [Paenirhodobacter sp.]|uniref:DUF1217 domain-containing protein n=1 Tax=Paenirhodobacter sp. TaxID=1965326 RepID=UPI003D0DF64F